MGIPVHTTPPDAQPSYIIDQLEGERITLPGSKGAFRILASSKQTNGGIAVFTSGAVLSDAPGFHYHNEAHDIFLVTKGYQKLWNGDKCRIMGAWDFAYAPPKVIHNPQLLGPHTETLGLVAPGDWVDFFRYVGESYGGLIIPEGDDRNLRELLIPKLMAAKEDFDVNFVRDYQPPELGEWLETENQLPGPLEPYFLRANTGPRWVLGGVMSRPFINVLQTAGKFAVSSIESSNHYGKSALNRWLTFPDVAHCFLVTEGLLKVKTKDEQEWSTAREGQTVVLGAGQTFSIEFASKYVRFISFTNGPGIEEIIQTAGAPYDQFVIPEEAQPFDEVAVKAASEKIGAQLE